MKSSPQADHYWKVLLAAHPRRSRFRLNDLLEAFHDAFPHHEGDLNARQRLAGLLGQLAEEGFLRLPKIANRRAYDHGERTLLPRYVNRIDLPQPLQKKRTCGVQSWRLPGTYQPIGMIRSLLFRSGYAAAGQRHRLWHCENVPWKYSATRNISMV